MHTAAKEAESAALRTLLRSLGQIVLQPNAFTGACLLAAWVISDPRLACAALIGATTANIGAVLAGYDEHDTRAGLHGFNGALAGLAAFVFIADNATAAAVAILAATAIAWLLAPWSRWLRRWGLNGYSSPCLIVTWIWLPLTGLEGAAVPHGNLATLTPALDGVLSGLAQTGFASGIVAGMLVLAGIAGASRRAALWALTGAALAGALHLMLGASLASFEAGLVTFNGALTALALCRSGWRATFGGVLLAVFLQWLAGFSGLLVMTMPFVIATWCVQRVMMHGHPGHRANAQNSIDSLS